MQVGIDYLKDVVLFKEKKVCMAGKKKKKEKEKEKDERKKINLSLSKYEWKDPFP